MIHLLLLATLGLTGCVTSTWGNADVKNKDLVAQIQTGQSTKESIKKTFGEPTTVSRGKLAEALPGDREYNMVMDEWWTYFHYQDEMDWRHWIPVVGSVLSTDTTDVHYFIVGFDAKGVVQHVASGQQKGKHTGALVGDKK